MKSTFLRSSLFFQNIQGHLRRSRITHVIIYCYIFYTCIYVAQVAITVDHQQKFIFWFKPPKQSWVNLLFPFMHHKFGMRQQCILSVNMLQNIKKTKQCLQSSVIIFLMLLPQGVMSQWNLPG